MAKNYSNKNRKRKAVIAMLCALSVTCTGLAAACAPNEEDSPSTAVTAKEDTQLLKNGNFEHFDIPDKAVHLIKNVNNWTLSGDSSVKSGIIGTSKSDWDKLTDPELATTLDYNNDLSADNEEYVNYNSMRSRDILYKDNYAALLDSDKVEDSFIKNQGLTDYFGITGSGTDDDPYMWNKKPVYYSADDKDFYLDSDFTNLLRKALIENPGTHYGDFKEEDGKYYYGDTPVYADDKGNYYLDDKKEKETVGNILMLHNSATDSTNNGLHQYYSSSTITLEAQTSAEISLWVKTSDLKFDKGYAATAEEEDKGAYIEVVQTVAGKSVDSFKIKAINTENIIASAEKDGKTTTASNGWVQYTVYVNACDFANSTVQLRLGLGDSENNEKVSGYAFFDDVQVTKYRDLTAAGCTYDATKVANTTCMLTSEEEDKIFYADVTTKNAEKDLHPYDFHYLIDLASENAVKNSDSQENGGYTAIPFGTSNVKVGLTTEKDTKGVEYAAATVIDESAKIGADFRKTQEKPFTLPKDLDPRPTDNDLVTVFDGTKTSFAAGDFNGQDFSSLLNNIAGDKYGAHKLPAAQGGNTLVMFSGWGAPYTATITNSAFTVPGASADGKDGYLLLSFWVKTSDMDGDTAATVKIYEYKDADKKIIDEDSVQTLTIDTTGKTTDFEKEKDIYNGWVQCFAFVKNSGKAEDPAKTFQIDFSFGATSIISTTSYESGYAAIANLQMLKINEDIYNLASASDNTAVFSFSNDDEEESGTPFDEATGIYDVGDGVALPDSYKGMNGANVLGSMTPNSEALNAGLINRDVFNDTENKYAMTDPEKLAVLRSFVSTASSWNDVFGENCYQPLIIVNSLREYALKANANETNFKDYYTKNDDGTYTKVAQDAEYDENKTYYSLNKVANYGFVGSEETVSANGREVISVRVKVTGNAKAYIYLINTDTVEGTNTGDILNFTTPSYTFWYDEEGNVLDSELDEDWTPAVHREHIVYTLREDGLYDGKDGKVYANLYNLTKSYKDSKYELNKTYYDKDGNKVDYDDLKDGVDYYKSATVSADNFADHYLCSSDGTNVYEYIDGKYYYVEITKTDDTTTETTNKEIEVNTFDPVHARYTNPDIDKQLYAEVTAEDCATLGEDGWVTVNFVIKAGSEEKKYRLELWSGNRNEAGVKEDGAIAFDYFHGTVSENRLTSYEDELINAYIKAVAKVAPELLETDMNVSDFEKLLNSDDLTEEQKTAIKNEMASYSYEASYYTFTFYDSSAYVPFNAKTAGDGETGYNYDHSSFEEQLAYLEFEDASRHEKNVFVDYSAVDQSITKNTVDDEEEPEEEENTGSAELGLYISSIVLVVVLLITLVSILITQYIRKKKKVSAKNNNKNVYRKRDRYVKKLHLVKDEIVEPEDNGTATSPAEDVPAEEVPETEEVTELPAEEPAETVEPAPAEEASEDKSDDGENKE